MRADKSNKGSLGYTIARLLLLNAVAAFAIGMTFWLVVRGQTIIAAIWLLPWIAIFLALLLPGRNIGDFALSEPIPWFVPGDSEPRWRYQIRLTVWWLVGSLSCPLSLALADFSRQRANYFGEFEAVLVLPIPIFGVACFLMAMRTIVRAFVAYRQEAASGDPAGAVIPRAGALYSVDGFKIVKVLVVDDAGVHFRLYENWFKRRPGRNELATLDLGSPIHDEDSLVIPHVLHTRSEFRRWEPCFITNHAIVDEELNGYREWQQEAKTHRSQ